jgi:Ser/Thr protein kinase RdoA (MazF antagonist)
MMNVQTMRHVVDAVRAGVLPPVVTAAAARWNAREPVHVRSSANHVFRVARDGRPCYLRLSHDSERDAGAIGAELDFIGHALTAGVGAARPLPSTGGALIETLADDGQRYHAVLFEALLGRQHDEVGELDERMIRAWGGTLARLHLASETFPAGAARPDLRGEIRAALDGLPSGEPAVAGALADGLELLEASPPDECGLLHGDLELDNLFWDGDRVRVLDFDAAVHGWYGMDVAIALADVWHDGGGARDQRLAWFLDGYSRARPLPATVHALLPRLVGLLSALKMARLLRAYATTGDGGPAWVAAMRNRHERWLSARRAALERG